MIIISVLRLIWNRVKRHRLRMDRLNNLIQRRSNIEARMCASSQNIMNAFIYADKALAFAFARRIQGIGKYQNVGRKDPPLTLLGLMSLLGTDCISSS